MIVLASIVIVWNVVFYILNSSASQTGIGQFSVGGQIDYNIQTTNNILNVEVRRS